MILRITFNNSSRSQDTRDICTFCYGDWFAQVRRVCNQNADMVSQASATTSRLKKTQRDLHTAREALDAERSVRERGEVTVGVLERELMEERVGCDKLRKEAVMEREMRRQSDIQASVSRRELNDIRR